MQNHLVNILNTLSNASQLRNIWLRSPDERLVSWREFRLELQELYNSCDGDTLLSSLEAISTWWSFAPYVNVSIDPYSPEHWPTVWEMIADGKICKYSRGLAMAFNAHYLDPDLDVQAARVFDHKSNDEYLVAIINERIVLNTPYATAVYFQDVDYIEVKEQRGIRNYLRNKRH